VTLQIVESLIVAAGGVIYDRHMFIVQATGHNANNRRSFKGLPESNTLISALKKKFLSFVQGGAIKRKVFFDLN
jgi:hypothetical protein